MTVAMMVDSREPSRAMDRYAAGDEAAFAEVYDGIASQLLASLNRRTRDPARAEDLLQLTFLQIHRSRGTFIAGSDVLPWAHAIARRLFIDDLRYCKRHPVALTGTDASETAASGALADGEYYARDMARRMRSTLESLPRTQREAFELLRFDGLSHEQAAAVLCTTVCAVKLRAHRAYEALRRTLEESAPTTGR
jgi:RNA polymerase sigma-70 factor (ECF subfamily)